MKPTLHPLGPPRDWKRIELSISNFDHTIDEGMEEALRQGGVHGRHAARNFNGRVWFAEGGFFEQVWQYHEPIKTLMATDLNELMRKVNDEFGWD